MRTHGVIWATVLTVASGGGALDAAQLHPRTVAAWDAYVTSTEQRIERELADDEGFLVQDFNEAAADARRAVLDGEDDGFARVHLKKGGDRILGATIVGGHAGEMISEITVAMKAGAGLGVIGSTIHPYPTQADALRKVANQMRRARFSDRQKSLLSRWFGWTR